MKEFSRKMLDRGGLSVAFVVIFGVVAVSPVTAQMVATPVGVDDPNTEDPNVPLPEPTSSTNNAIVATILDSSVTYVRGTTFTRVMSTPPHSPNDPAVAVSADRRYMGTLTGALTPANLLLPAANRTSSNQFYETGGIFQANTGFVLATGLSADSLSGASFNTVPTGRGVGTEGPNNGWEATNDGIPNQGDVHFSSHRGVDVDYKAYVANNTAGTQTKDACAVEFVIEVDRPGFLEVDLVFATDEWPAQLELEESMNDSVGILVKRLPPDGGSVPSAYSADYENLFKVRHRHATTSEVTQVPFDMRKLVVGNSVPSTLIKLLRANRMAPAPSDLVNSPSDPFLYGTTQTPNHFQAKWYDHEFSGFTYKLRRASGETLSANIPLPIGGTGTLKNKYKVKLVVQDQFYLITSAVFIPAGGIRFRSTLPGDFNLDGNCDGSDFNIWNANKFSYGNYHQGDANFDGEIDGLDFNIWNANKFTVGSYAFSFADANNDGQVTSADLAILNAYDGLENCATRFEGDVNKDGRVNSSDRTLLEGLLDP